MHIKNKFEWCLKKAKEGGHGIKEIKPNLNEARYHIEKATYNLKVMNSNIKLGYNDWAVSSAFYAMYHAILALLYKMGYESTNQECSINAIEYFILVKKIDLDAKYIKMIDPNVDDSIIKLRERFQYGSETKVSNEILSLIKNNAKEFVEKFQELI